MGMVSFPIGSLITGLNPSATIHLLGGMFPSRRGPDRTKQFSKLKEALDLDSDEACYLYYAGLSAQVQEFLLHHKLPETYNEVIQDVQTWGAQYENTLPVKATHLNSVQVEVAGPPADAKAPRLEVITRPGGGFMLSNEEKSCRVAQGLCLYCSLTGHTVMNCSTAQPNSFEPPSNPQPLMAAEEGGKKATTSLYSIFPITLGSNTQKYTTPPYLAQEPWEISSTTSW
ncbi:hypothetical protein DSO57_1037985 [Entomophthora muscae]|uniref:Uncharacterized protein n=1 Tax=Entomophthora muscae TaxID=34485 RepID=A0ACC2SBY6_9FUNG|nr:hypothetical protein DSO57_1037985 [Entomophthora muscae]